MDNFYTGKFLCLESLWHTVRCTKHQLIIFHPLLYWNIIRWIFPGDFDYEQLYQSRYVFSCYFLLSTHCDNVTIKTLTFFFFCCFLFFFIQPLWNSSQVYEKVCPWNKFYFQFACLHSKGQWDVTCTCTCYRVLKLSECTRPCLEHQGSER